MGLKYDKRTVLFLTVFIICLFICLLVTAFYIQNKSKMENAQMEQVVLVYSNKINNVITKLLFKTQVLAALVVQNNGDVTEFERVAAVVLDDPAVKNVLIAPNGVVNKVYPLEGNEQALGLNFFKPGEGNKEAIEARETGELVLGGPFDLVQGGKALVGRLPVYVKDSENNKVFWGLVSVTLYYPEALSGADLDQLQNQGFAYEIWRMNPDTNERQTIAVSPYSYNRKARYIEKNLSILNAAWQFRISPVKNWYEHNETWIFGISGLLISLLAAFFTINTYNLNVIKTELEILTKIDPLTGALNRRGMLAALTDLLKTESCKLILCYIDLNKFKFFNDKFGHGVGDKILQKFAETFVKNIGKKHLFARMGGDEFVLVFEDTDSETEIQTFFDLIKHEMNRICVDERMNGITITFSVGKALYPSQCKNLDDLLSCADRDMYMNKTGKAEL